MRAKETFGFDLWQGGIVVASVESPDGPSAVREIMHYAMMYSQDGPCEITARGKKPSFPQRQITTQEWQRAQR